MNRSLRLAFAVVLLPLLTGAAAPPRAAVDRGRLSLAWDAHDSGRCDESLGYLEDIGDDSPVAPDAAWLRAECLFDLGRYAEAVAVLDSAPAQSLSDRPEFLFDVYWAWVRDATSRESWGEALAAAEAATRHLPKNRHLAAVAEAARFRQVFARALTAKKGRSHEGPESLIRPRDAGPPEGAGWEQAYPWGIHLPWVPRSTLAEWMPSLAESLDTERKALWLRFPSSQLGREIGREARRAGLDVRTEPGGYLLSGYGEELSVDEDEWRYRAAAEGLGIRGAALQAAADAEASLRVRARISRWVQDHRGRLEIERTAGGFRLRDPETWRTFDLELAAWEEGFSPESEDWLELWADLNTELGRRARPFRCFCGREVRLREIVGGGSNGDSDPGEGPGTAAPVISLCPLHQREVTDDLLESWGVGWKEVWERVRQDATAQTWDLGFERGEVQGGQYVAFTGDGVSGLSRHPALLLGAIEAVEGVGAGGRAVRVVAPSPSLLVVSTGSDGAAEAGAAKALLAASRRGEKVSKTDYRTTVRLPMTGLGSFRLRPAE